MKITHAITMASALLLAAGCAHEERSYSSNETGYSSGRISEYNSQNTYRTPSVGGSYSADGSYSSGGGGTYSSQPNYSGSVGADGTYTPNATTDSSVASGYAGAAGTESDDAVVAQVRESLRQDPEIALIVPEIQISAHNGAIILNGHVQSEEQKRQILSKVQGITGVVTVNNQLNVMAGPNGQNSNGSQMTPTGNSSQSQPIYKDANGQDLSTNNALNSNSSQNGPGQLNQRDTLNPTSRTNSSSQIYHDSNQDQNIQQQNSNLSTNNLNPTSRPDGQSQLYQNGQQQNESNMNQTSNSVNGANNMMTPTSRENGSSQIYQNNPGESLQNQNTNNVQNNNLQNNNLQNNNMQNQ